ncbi:MULTISPECIES: FAD-dependent monooxygenase [unclassified Nocardia]|uniref:FAD-dependent monooxygenase n=1 Tax=unclassified Nocardia TaxID=2637762 RepID=UPI001C4EE423|nr:FAD-dependent monooxygenase [Nocardia sp. MH4]
MKETVISTNSAERVSRHTQTVIVGGSLGGLTAALSLAARGTAVTVLERTTGRTQRGVAILVSVQVCAGLSDRRHARSSARRSVPPRCARACTRMPGGTSTRRCATPSTRSRSSR